MKFGVREICEVVLKAKSTMDVGNKRFYKNEPVIYFDSLKTSSMEGASTTVYAQGGRGNARLIAWEGERTVTYTMEDALLSPESFSVLAGAGLVEAKSGASLKQHVTEQVDYAVEGATVTINLKYAPMYSDKEHLIYVMPLDDNGEITTEPYCVDVTATENVVTVPLGEKNDADGFNTEGGVALVDYYVKRESGMRQIDITPESFGGNFYLEASTLFRDQATGKDFPAEFIIPNCKIQSNFTFTMASSGDPSSFTFTMDAFPDYTRFDRTKKVLTAIQIIDPDTNTGDDADGRKKTNHTEDAVGL